MEIQWKYATPISEKKIAKVEKLYGVQIPDELKAVIKEGNNGVPSKRFFDTDKAKEHEVKTLLSYNKGDIENIYSAAEILKEAGENLFPFANDPAGNLICLSENEVVLWNHETNEIERIAGSVDEFFVMLY